MSTTDKLFSVFQITTLAWLTGWFIKIKFFHSYLSYIIYAYPVMNNQFPPFFQNPALASSAFYLPVICFAGVLFRRRSVYQLISLLLLLCAVILGLHTDTYNDMTFISSFWVALWLVWYAFHLHDPDHIRQHAPFLAKCIIAVIFLGGTVGKLTHEYWSGEAFYNLLIHVQPQYLGRLIHDNLPLDQQKIFSGIFSKIVIFVEGSLIFSPIMPYYMFSILSVVAVITIVLFRSWTILSVLLCLAGMVLSCLILIDKESNKLITQPPYTALKNWS